MQQGQSPRLFESREGLKEGGKWEETECNTYRSEITNKGQTLDGCRLDALDSVSSRVWSGRFFFFLIFFFTNVYIRGSRIPGQLPDLVPRRILNAPLANLSVCYRLKPFVWAIYGERN